MSKPFSRYEQEISVSDFVSRSIRELSTFNEAWVTFTSKARKFTADEWQRRFDKFRDTYDGAGLIPEEREETKS